MATLTVWRFDTPGGAETASRTLEKLSRDNLVVVHDAAVVEWAEGTRKPSTRQLDELAGTGALEGAFWGLLFGLIFLVPLLDAAIGATTGALSASLADVGIDDTFIDGVRGRVTPGSSALFVITSNAVLGTVHDAFADADPEPIFTRLDDEQERALADVFGA